MKYALLYHSNFLGIPSFEGGPFEFVTDRWYHLCILIAHTDQEAERETYLDGVLNHKTKSKLISEVKWPKGHNLTIGGRELELFGSHFNGQIADVQMFSRLLSKKEIEDFSFCKKVCNYPLTLLVITIKIHAFIRSKETLDIGTKLRLGVLLEERVQ